MRAVSTLALLLLLARSAPAQEVLDESWGVMTIMNLRVGYVHTVRTRHAKPGGVEIETYSQSRMTVKRMGAGIELHSDVRHFETPDGKPLRFTSRMVMSSTPTLNEGVIENGRLKLKTTAGGITKEQELPWDPECLLMEGSRLLTLKKGFAPGTKYTYKTFSAEFGKVNEVEVEVQGPDTRKVKGKERPLTRVQAKSSLQQGVVVTAWMDEKGHEVAGETSMVGIKIVVEAATKEEALKNAAAELPEIFFQTMPRSNVALPRPREITALTVRMERPDGDFADWKPPTSTQSVRSRDAKTVTLRVEAPGPEPKPAPPGPEHAMFLKPSPGVQCDDEDIVRTAREIAGDEKDRWLAARRLAGWVHRHIDKKSMDIGAASAKEVFTNRAGDCSEHAVLLTAMLRAAGIPAKVCGGYLYYRGAWGGHAWSSAWVGRWVDFDATLGDGPADGARIKFSETDAEDAGAVVEGMRGAGFMHGGMKIEVLEYTIDGKTMSVAPPSAPTGNRFEAPLLGVSFEKPDGWSFREPKDLPPFTLAVLESPDGRSRAVISYIDLSYDLVRLDTKKAARKLGAPSSGELGKLSERETYESDRRFYVRLSAGEVLELVLQGAEDAPTPLEHYKKTLKITR